MALLHSTRAPPARQGTCCSPIAVRSSIAPRFRHRVVSSSIQQAEFIATSVDSTSSKGAEPQQPHAPSASPEADVSSVSSFQWLSHWYPVHTLEAVDPSRPHAIELLGKQLVLWRDGQGNWQCMEDACPHRLAPLSEGRIESDGTLQCSYHGWRFNSEGKCTEIPQAIDDKAKAVACSSSRSCVTCYPVREEVGLIWVWPSAGPAAQAAAAAAPTPVSKGLAAAWQAGSGHGTWYRRELPYSWDTLVENLTDPSHLPFSHHKLSPNLLRSKGTSMPFRPIEVPQGDTPEDEAARPSWSFGHKAPIAAYEFPSALSPGGRVCFSPPSTVVYEYDLGPHAKLQNDLIAVPAGPGRSVAYTVQVSSASKVLFMRDIVKTLFTNPKQLPLMLVRYSYQRRPAYKSHLGMNKLFDQDNVFLNMQDRQLALRGKSSWVQDYYMPTPCDGLVIAGRRWTEQALKQPLSSSPSIRAPSGSPAPPAAAVISLSPEAAAAPRLSPRELNDRYSQHTKHCSVCQKALQGLKQKLAAGQAAAAALLAALVGVLAGAVLPGLLASSGSSAAGAAAGVTAGSGAVGVAGVVAAVMGVGLLLAHAVASAAAKEIEQFEYVEFSHADNH